MKTKINLMDDNDNDLEALLLNTPAIDTNANNMNNNINNVDINDLIDKESIKENNNENNDKGSSIVVVNDNE